MALEQTEVATPGDHRANFIKSVLDEIARRPEARDEVLADILYYQQSFYEMITAFQQQLSEMGPGGLMKMMMGRGK